MAELSGLEAIDLDIAIQFKASSQKVLACYGRLLASPPTARELATHIGDKRIRKLDEYLADDLLVESLARDYIDIPGAYRLIDTLPAVGDAQGRRAL